MQALLFRHCFATIGSFLLAYFLIPFCITIAQKLKLLDAPDGKIKKHKVPVPHLGGIAIFGAFFFTMLCFLPISSQITSLLFGSAILLLLGFVDDLHILQPLQKFLGQVVAVALFLRNGMILKPEFFASWLNVGIAGFWMLSIINAFNLVDVMDGLSSTIALVAGLSFFTLAVLFEQYSLSLLLAIFIGSIVAFLLHNKPPARIYLGDAGAMFVGGFFSFIPLLFSWGYHSYHGFYAPAIILAIPLLEVLGLVVIRSAKGIPFYQGSPHHFSIYLLGRGWSKKQVLRFTAMIGAMLGVVAVGLATSYFPLWSVICAGCGFVVVWNFIIFGSRVTVLPSLVTKDMSDKSPVQQPGQQP